MGATNITHTNLAVQAFKRAHGRAPLRSINLRSYDEAWLENWVAEHVARLCREDPSYAHDYAIRTTWRERRRTQLRLKTVRRAAESASADARTPPDR